MDDKVTTVMASTHHMWSLASTHTHTHTHHMWSHTYLLEWCCFAASGIASPENWSSPGRGNGGRGGLVCVNNRKMRG